MASELANREVAPPPDGVFTRRQAAQYEADLGTALASYAGVLGTSLVMVTFVLHRGALRCMATECACRNVAHVLDDHCSRVSDVTGRAVSKSERRLVSIQLRIGWRKNPYRRFHAICIRDRGRNHITFGENPAPARAPAAAAPKKAPGAAAQADQ